MKKVVANGRPHEPVACPRCHSWNTKFCYFNNYNLKQPRHFCRDCKRYWTAGGSLRNVPIGAGQRKHKMSVTPWKNLFDGNRKATKLNSDADEWIHISPMNPGLSPPLNQHVACNSNCNLLPEVRGLALWSGTGLVPAYGSMKPRFSQSTEHSAIDNAENSSTSVVSNPWEPNTVGLTSAHFDSQTSQLNRGILTESGRNIAAMGLKSPFGNGAIILEKPCELDDTVQDDKPKVIQDEASTDRKPSFNPSYDRSEYDRSEYDMPSSDGSETLVRSDRIDKMPENQAPLPAEEVTRLNGFHPLERSLPLASNSLGFKSVPIPWGPLMWPWIWPLLANTANAPSLSFASDMSYDGQSAVEGSKTSQLDMTYTSGLLPSFPYCPYALNAVPSWSMNWNSSSEDRRISSEESEKEMQGLLFAPKTLRLDCLDKSAYSSMLKTLGVTALSQSRTEFLNTFHPKGEVFQPHLLSSKAVKQSEPHHCHVPFLNSASQACSIFFQEGRS